METHKKSITGRMSWRNRDSHVDGEPEAQNSCFPEANRRETKIATIGLGGYHSRRMTCASASTSRHTPRMYEFRCPTPEVRRRSPR
jgi:hypothetical protein